MDDAQEHQYAMTTVLVKFLTDNRPAIKPSKVADAEAADVLAAYEALSAVVGTAPTSTKENTQSAETAREKLYDALFAIQGPLRSIATKSKDTDLLARATLSNRQLRRLRPEELRDVSAALFAAATAHAKDLADYALDASALASLQAVQTAFAATVRSTSSLIDQRSTANQSAEELLAELMQQVYELDKPMAVFSHLNQPLFNGYEKARRVGGRSHRKPGGKPSGPAKPA